VQLGYRTVLVLSGGTRREDLARYAYRPDLVVDSIAELHHARLVEQFGADRTAGPPVNGNAPALSGFASSGA